ncbi:MAG: hypothetical protein ACRER4_01855 [Steroidobacteraceae bacterium]
MVVQPVYDIYAVAQNTAMGQLTLFTVPLGQTYNFNGVTAFTKGLGHTNLVQAGMLESSYTFIVRALSFYVQGLQGAAAPLLHVQDLINILSSFVQFSINRKPYFEGILGWLPGGGGAALSGFGTLTAPVSSHNSTNGWPETDNVYALPGGQFINPQENFSCLINPTQNAGGTPSALATAGSPAGVVASGLMGWFRMDGTLIRVAQ